jgi:hypothetical protein
MITSFSGSAARGRLKRRPRAKAVVVFLIIPGRVLKAVLHERLGIKLTKSAHDHKHAM